MNFTIEIRGLKELSKNLIKNPVGDIVQNLLFNIGNMFAAEARDLSPVFTGLMHDNYFVYGNGGITDITSSVEVVANIYYTPYMEYGTRPHWPPRAALVPWAEAHNVPVFIVQRAIARRGNLPNHMFQQAYIKNLPKMADMIEKATRNIEIETVLGRKE